MGVSYRHARRFHGYPVIAHCMDGRTYTGMVRRVTPDAIWIRRMRPGVAPISAQSQEPDVSTAEIDHNEIPEVEQVQFFNPYYGAAIALPLYTLLALSLFWW